MLLNLLELLYNTGKEVCGCVHKTLRCFNVSEPVRTTVRGGSTPLYYRGNTDYRVISLVRGGSTLPNLFEPLYNIVHRKRGLWVSFT